jgi:hypothetical protein
MCLCLLCLCLYVMDWVCMRGGVHLLELILPVVRKRQSSITALWTFAHDTRKKKRHAAHTAQSRPRVRSDACRMGHPGGGRGYVRDLRTLGPTVAMCVLAYSTRSQLKLEGRVALDLFGIPALLERLEGDPEISKSDCLCVRRALGGRRRVSALADSR